MPKASATPHFLELLAHRALSPPPSSSLQRKNASAHSSSVRRRAIPDARSYFHVMGT
jgi:hypothetical protein